MGLVNVTRLLSYFSSFCGIFPKNSKHLCLLHNTMTAGYDSNNVNLFSTNFDVEKLHLYRRQKSSDKFSNTCFTTIFTRWLLNYVFEISPVSQKQMKLLLSSWFMPTDFFLYSMRHVKDQLDCRTVELPAAAVAGCWRDGVKDGVPRVSRKRAGWFR